MKITTIAALSVAALSIGVGGAVAGPSLMTSNEIKDGSVLARDLSPSLRAQIAKHGVQGIQGPAGPTGPTGAVGIAVAGPQGPAGASASASLTTVTGPTVYLNPGQDLPAFVYCPVGMKATGGGFVYISGNGTVFGSKPSDDGTGWIVYLDNFNDPIMANGTPYVVCTA